MPYQLWIADVARAAGLKVAEQPGWKTRGSSVFNPKAVLAHHTAIDDDAISVRVVTKGRPDLPGPLSQFVLGKDGTVYVIAAGKANHTGEGSWAGLSGNLYFFGIEAVNKGDGTPWPQVQLDAYYKLAAALVKSLGVGADKVASHAEYATPPGRKIDPKGIDMSDFRAKVATLLEAKPMYDPPFNIPGGVAAHLKAPGGGVWVLGYEGHIYAFDSQHKGQPAGQSYWGTRKAARLEPFGEGYTVVAVGSGERYDYG